VAGTLGWQAPEIVEEEPNTPASDVFSLGLVLFYLLSGGDHALGPSKKHLPHLMTLSFPAGAGAVELRKNLARLTSPEARDLLGRMLGHEPSERPPIADVLAHPFFFGEDAQYALLCRAYNDRLRDVHGPGAREEALLRRHGGGALLPWLSDGGGGGSAADDVLWADLVTAAERAGYAYNKGCVAQLLRLVRNTSDGRGGGHYDALPPALKERLDGAGGIARVVLARFPALVLAAWRTLQELKG